MATEPRAEAAYIYSPAMSRHVLRDDHPMRPVRLQWTYELLNSYGAFGAPGSRLVAPRPATQEELSSSHSPEYVEAVRRYSEGGLRSDSRDFGFSDGGDNPIYPGMYEAAALSTGASIVGAELVADGQVHAAFNPGGGLHHAMASTASGFCVFNDPVVAIQVLRRRGLRVAYVDIDVHHGDGVQAAFYGDADVLTISIHESGGYLFPGTGGVEEIGAGEGTGYCVNLPLFPHTGDTVYLEAFEAVVPPLLRAFRPDVLTTQLGIDTHFMDPLAHLMLTSRGYVRAVEILSALGYPWLAFGGGGYDLDAVARCWTLAYGVMLGRQWPNQLPAAAPKAISSPQLHDQEQPAPDPETQRLTRQFALAGVDAIRSSVFPVHGI